MELPVSDQAVQRALAVGESLLHLWPTVLRVASEQRFQLAISFADEAIDQRVVVCGLDEPRQRGDGESGKIAGDQQHYRAACERRGQAAEWSLSWVVVGHELDGWQRPLRWE